MFSLQKVREKTISLWSFVNSQVLATHLSCFDAAHEQLDQRLINPRRACAARVTALGLCVSVDDYSRTTGNDTAYEQ